MSNEQSNNRPEKFNIIVNGRRREVEAHELTYLQVVQLAFPGETPSDTIVFTVTYSHRNNRDGTMVEGDKVNLANGMIFNVTRTDKS